MKTEEFDDAIKRKLESIDPLVDEKEIERVHRFTVVNRSPFSMLKTNRVFWVLMVTGMLATGLLTWKLTSLNDQRKNMAEVVKVQPVPPQLEANQATRVVTKTDTVYLTKYVNKRPDINEKPKGVINKNDKTEHNRFMKKSTGDISGNKPGSINDMTFTLNQNSVQQGHKNTSNPPTIIDKNQDDNKGAEIQRTNNLQKTATDLKRNDTINQKNLPVEKEIIKKVPIHNYSEEHKKNTTKSPLNLGFMAGIGGEWWPTQYGGGIYARLLAKRFSFNAGLKLMSINYQSYNNDNDFFKAKGYPFINLCHHIGQNPPPYCQFSNIDITYTMWQVPLAIEYDLPVAKGWSFSASLGTDLDVSCSATIQYNQSDYSYGTQSENIASSYPTVIFNNLIVSMGLIKQWGHFNIQASPFVSQQVEKAWYKGTDKTFYGANLKAFYVF